MIEIYSVASVSCDSKNLSHTEQTGCTADILACHSRKLTGVLSAAFHLALFLAPMILV